MSEQTIQQQAAEPAYHGSIPWPGESVSAEFAEALRNAEKAFGCPVWALADTNDAVSMIDPGMYKGFLGQLPDLRARKDQGGVALLVDSLGGDLHSAFKIAMLLRRSCGQVKVLVPRQVASAATLFALGADELYLGQESQLGPLDVQVTDSVLEMRRSALDEVQSLDRLHSAAIDKVIETLRELRDKVQAKRADAYIPYALDFVNEFMRPLLEKIDTVHYTEWSRSLKIGEDYATLLLDRRYGEESANIARHIVNDYPAHEFVIGYEEAKGFLMVADPDQEQQAALDDLCRILWRGEDVMLGRLME